MWHWFDRGDGRRVRHQHDRDLRAVVVHSTARLQRVGLGALERYGEVLSGAFIALVGLAFWIWRVL